MDVYTEGVNFSAKVMQNDIKKALPFRTTTLLKHLLPHV